VVLMSVRTLQFLSGHPQNKRAMKDFPGLVDKLTMVAHVSDAGGKAREFASLALGNLGVLTQQKDWWMDDKENASSGSTWAADAARNKQYHTLTLQVDGLEDAGTCVIAQRVLVNVKGVISVSIDKSRGHALVGTRGGDAGLLDKLQEALARAGLAGAAWPLPSPVLNASGASAGPEAAAEEENDDSGYLDADAYDPAVVEGGAIAKWGHSSLEARLAEQRREEELRAAKTERLLNKVGSALTTAGSWLLGW
jgi:hypothetical protein